MSERTEGQIVIGANAPEIMDVLTDFEAYPEWADVKSATVLERGEGGIGTKVAFEVDVPVLGKASYTLAYRYAPGDGGMSWVSTEARGAVSNITGEYLLTEVEDDETKVIYRLSVDLGVLLPGFVRTQGEKRVIANALEGLRSRVEYG
ncbi:MAG TPA: SRPBCC family protein [Actinomycetota bacterium]|nr:SRPBCC family protein [Actinomycetota bacterium]HEX5903323.1 SRPBCC family protein [Actinomycetota bacterium]